MSKMPGSFEGALRGVGVGTGADYSTRSLDGSVTAPAASPGRYLVRSVTPALQASAVISAASG
jgi:hypothetical protein